MSNRPEDINDDEIRIISSSENRPKSRRRRRMFPICAGIIAALVIVGLIYYFSKGDESADEPALTEQSVTTTPPQDAAPFTERRDTVIDGTELSIFTPRNATPSLEIGSDAADDSTAVLTVQAADIREDNLGIVGSFVIDGELISKGEAKAGFCSIINGQVSIGVADATPMLEQALTSGGDFFRQYPLVVAGQIVENKPKGRAIRRALADIGGTVCVVESNERLTFREFSQALVDAGVRDAIYLVSGGAYGRYTDASGQSHVFGPRWDNAIGNVNYLVWR